MSSCRKRRVTFFFPWCNTTLGIDPPFTHRVTVAGETSSSVAVALSVSKGASATLFTFAILLFYSFWTPHG
jgi:hypothetical protein